MPLRILLLITFSLGLMNIGVSAQDKSFAKKIIDTLSSPYFAGRGYIDNGDLKAARFISSKFREFKLNEFEGAKGYVQPFQMPVNTFPGKMSVSIDGELLIPGKDYIVDPVSGGCKNQSLKLVFVDSVRLLQMENGNPGKLPHGKFALVFDKKQLEKAINDKGFEKIISTGLAAIVSINEGSLIWSVSSVNIDIPFIEIKRNAIKNEAQKITIQIDALKQDHSTQNVTGYIKGSEYPDSFIFITAHYDHLGKMGKDTYFPGANDNASGVAMMLDLAHYFSERKIKPKYSIGFISFAGEEAGLIGSKYYTDYPVEPLKNIAFLINMDLMANGQTGMMVVNGSVFPKEYEKLVHINDSAQYLYALDKRGKASNSDHYWFSEKGVKAFFFYLLGKYPYYHDIYDTADKPTMAGYDGAFRLIRDFIVSYRQ